MALDRDRLEVAIRAEEELPVRLLRQEELRVEPRLAAEPAYDPFVLGQNRLHKRQRLEVAGERGEGVQRAGPQEEVGLVELLVR